MKLTEFKAGDKLRIPGSNKTYELKKESEIIELFEGDDFFHSDVLLICRDDWELVEQTYTTREAFKMLAEGKVMISCEGNKYKFDDEGLMLILYSNTYAFFDKKELKGLWTEFKEKN